MDEPNSTERLGAKLRDARNSKDWSLDEATFQARHRFPDLRVRRGKIDRLERGVADRDRLDVVVVLALASLYGIEVDDLGDESVSTEAAAIKELVSPNSPWTPDHRPPPLHPVRMAA